MGLSIDIVASTLVDLLPQFEETFTQGHPILAYMMKRGIKRNTLAGPYREFAVVTGGPGDGKTIAFGPEVLGSVRRQNAVRGNEYCSRYIYYFDVPGKDLSEAGGKQDVVQIVKNYPLLATGDTLERFVRQVARGSASSGSDADGTGHRGFLSLNGDQSYYPQGTARTGVFQYAAPTAQTATVHGLPMSGAATDPTGGWHHQYGNIGSYSLAGEKMVRKLSTRANQQGKMTKSRCDLLMSDEGTYQNALEAYSDKVILIDEVDNPIGEFVDREGFKFGKMDWYWEPEIDITDTTSFSSTAAQTGVLYGLNTSFWEIIQLSGNPDKAGRPNFEMASPIQIPDQDAWQFRIIANLNLACHSLRNQFCMTGGAQT